MIAGLIIVGLIFGGGVWFGTHNERQKNYYESNRAVSSLQLSCIKNGGSWMIDGNGEYICLKQ